MSDCLLIGTTTKYPDVAGSLVTGTARAFFAPGCNDTAKLAVKGAVKQFTWGQRARFRCRLAHRLRAARAAISGRARPNILHEKGAAPWPTASLRYSNVLVLNAEFCLAGGASRSAWLSRWMSCTKGPDVLCVLRSRLAIKVDNGCHVL